ncbi:hypothetical protein [Nocardia sp. CA-119907]|uniref:hypothetical protein n=1 Tax=Nocardia sp. CA-119907 TaxID=3239973 RepID=UPI003D97E1A0
MDRPRRPAEVCAAAERIGSFSDWITVFPALAQQAWGVGRVLLSRTTTGRHSMPVDDPRPSL